MNPAALSGAGVGASPAPAWRSGLAYGTLWGLGVMGMETVLQPVAEMTGETVVFLASAGLELVAMGICTAWVAILVERHARLRTLPLIAVALAMVLSAADVLAGRTVYPLIGLPVFPRDVDALSEFSYHAWTGLFYGSLLLVSRVLFLRAERTRHLLGRAQLERSRSETMVGEVRLQALQGSVDPELLRDVMAEVQRRQGLDADGAERLLDDLVGFLRMAMPSLQHAPSTLAAELSLARAYARMRIEQSGPDAGWRIDAPADPGHLAFPPLLLLPLLDGLARLPRAQRELVLSARPTAAGAHLWMSAGLSMPASDARLRALTSRLEIGLRALHGQRFAIRHDADAGVLHIEIHPPAREPGSSVSSTTDQETCP